MAIPSVFTGTALIATALIRPQWLSRPAALWWRLARAMGYVNARIILTLFYVVLVVPTGALLKLARRDLLHARRQGTGWTPYPASGNDPAHFRRMY